MKYPSENVTSINLTILKGGIQRNVVPSEMSATFDIRFSIHADPDAFERQASKLIAPILYDSLNVHNYLLNVPNRSNNFAKKLEEILQ